MKKLIRLTESDLTRIVRRVIKEQDETAQADEVVKNVDVAQYCSAKGVPGWVTKTLNALPADKKEKAIEFIKNFGNAVSGKSVKELINLRRLIKQEKEKSQSAGAVNEQLAPIVIAGFSISASLLIAIGAILLIIIIFLIVKKSSGKKYGCGGPGWWNDL
jgi:hypothetical protein